MEEPGNAVPLRTFDVDAQGLASKQGHGGSQCRAEGDLGFTTFQEGDMGSSKGQLGSLSRVYRSNCEKRDSFGMMGCML